MGGALRAGWKCDAVVETLADHRGEDVSAVALLADEQEQQPDRHYSIEYTTEEQGLLHGLASHLCPGKATLEISNQRWRSIDAGHDAALFEQRCGNGDTGTASEIEHRRTCRQ